MIVSQFAPIPKKKNDQRGMKSSLITQMPDLPPQSERNNEILQQETKPFIGSTENIDGMVVPLNIIEEKKLVEWLYQNDKTKDYFITNPNLGPFLDNLRIKLNFTKCAFCKLLNKDPSHYSRIIQNKYGINLEKLVELCDNKTLQTAIPDEIPQIQANVENFLLDKNTLFYDPRGHGRVTWYLPDLPHIFDGTQEYVILPVIDRLQENPSLPPSPSQSSEENRVKENITIGKNEALDETSFQNHWFENQLGLFKTEVSKNPDNEEIIKYGYGYWVPLEVIQQGNLRELLTHTNWCKNLYLRHPQLGTLIPELRAQLKLPFKQLSKLIGRSERDYYKISTNELGVNLQNFLELPGKKFIQENLTPSKIEALQEKIESLLLSKETLIFHSKGRHQVNWSLANLETFQINGSPWVILPVFEYDTKEYRDNLRLFFTNFRRAHQGNNPALKDFEESPGKPDGFLNHEKTNYNRTFSQSSDGPGLQSTLNLQFKVNELPIISQDSSPEKINPQIASSELQNEFPDPEFFLKPREYPIGVHIPWECIETGGLCEALRCLGNDHSLIDFTIGHPDLGVFFEDTRSKFDLTVRILEQILGTTHYDGIIKNKLGVKIQNLVQFPYHPLLEQAIRQTFPAVEDLDQTIHGIREQLVHKIDKLLTDKQTMIRKGSTRVNWNSDNLVKYRVGNQEMAILPTSQYETKNEWAKLLTYIENTEKPSVGEAEQILGRVFILNLRRHKIQPQELFKILKQPPADAQRYLHIQQFIQTPDGNELPVTKEISNPHESLEVTNEHTEPVPDLPPLAIWFSTQLADFQKDANLAAERDSILAYGYGKWVPYEIIENGGLGELLRATNWFEHLFLTNPDLGSFLEQLRTKLNLPANKFSALFNIGPTDYGRIIKLEKTIALPTLINIPANPLIQKFFPSPEIADIRNSIDRFLTDKGTFLYSLGSFSHDNKFQWQLDNLEKFRVNGRIYAIIPGSIWDTKQERDKFRSTFRKLVDSNGGIAPMSPEIALKIGWGLIQHEKMVYGRTYPIFSKGSGAQPTLEQTFKVQDEQIKYQPWSERARYYVNRGLKTEELMKGLMIGWADENGFSYSKKAQTEVAPGRQLEIVCGPKPGK